MPMKPSRTPSLITSLLITIIICPRQYGTITKFTRNEIEKTLLVHCPDLVKTISLPIQKLPDFQSMGPMLSTLACLELYGITWHYNLEHAVEFVRQHSQLFGTIQTVKLSGPNDTKILKKPRIHNLLKYIKHPKTINLSRFKEAARDLNTFEFQNLQGLEQLIFDLDYVPQPFIQSQLSPIPLAAAATAGTNSISSQSSGAMTTTAMQPQIQNDVLLNQDNYTLDMIQKCTNLTTLHIGVREPTGFAWARDLYKNDPDSLPKLKTLHVSSNRTMDAKQILEDCVYAFQDTIQDFKGVSLKLSPLVPDIDTKFGLTQPLNQLTILSLKGELAAWFDLESLGYCPKLRELHLNLLPYSPPDLDHLSKISNTNATQLKVLSLFGRWTLSDNIMDLLGDSLQNLERLDLVGCECSLKASYNQHKRLTEQGLERNLKKLKNLARLEVDLPDRLEEMLKRYSAEHPRPLIRVLSEDLLK
ncbi:hypothetical protein BGZ76_004957 [Entomortierella beljakovae]|nr:hypothetical protein BGZ76_004957 [Entomortierella beljakovae]